MANQAAKRRREAKAAPAEVGDPTLQQRVESSPNGRAVISGFIIVTLAAMIISNLPDSTLRKTALPAVRPLLEATGLSQNWNLFAPNPRRSTLRLEARIQYADGTTSVWRTPISDPFVGEYRAFRWRKWAGYVVSDTRKALWPATAAWLARIHTTDGKTPVRVTLYRQFYYAPKPGSGSMKQPPWREDLLYTARVEGNGG